MEDGSGSSTCSEWIITHCRKGNVNKNVRWRIVPHRTTGQQCYTVNWRIMPHRTTGQQCYTVNNINTKIFTTNFGQKNKIHILCQRVQLYEVPVSVNLSASHSV
jgi:hypothetical protein